MRISVSFFACSIGLFLTCCSFEAFVLVPDSVCTSLKGSGSSTLLSAANSNGDDSPQEIFDQFAGFLQTIQKDIINEIESVDDSGEKFTKDKWGIFEQETGDNAILSRKSGGITRVIQRGDVVEKGACSLTLIQGGLLSAERAAAIQGRNDEAVGVVSEGDKYSAAALSMVLHTRNPMVPTFRSDVRIFLVENKQTGQTVAWFGGGADLTPYYLIKEDITSFHKMYRDLIEDHFGENPKDKTLTYDTMKKACDDYFYLPARSEHRGTGGIFFDDMIASSNTLSFVKGVGQTWMKSWLPIVKDRNSIDYTQKQRDWQLLRRGRYLEFNLLYDRGVKFGLANANPRVEGVMVSAPPLIAWEYNHVVEKDSDEEQLMAILKEPIDWI